MTTGSRRRKGPALAVIVPAYGLCRLTASVVGQLRAEPGAGDVYVVDSRGDYRPVADERVIRSATRLRWAAACNAGLRAAHRHGYRTFCLLNNDVVLSRHFLRGLLDAWVASDAGLVAPSYNHSWRHQWPRPDVTGLAADEYVPQEVEREIPFADGTCLLIPRATLDRVGYLDDTTWPVFGWGCDQDLSIRVRAAGLRVVVTHRSYLNHLGRCTSRLDSGFSERAAQQENDCGMVGKWGESWNDRLFAGFPDLDRAPVTQQALDAMRQGDAPTRRG